MSRTVVDAIDDLITLVCSYVEEGESLHDILESEWMKNEVSHISKRYGIDTELINKVINKRLTAVM